MIAPTRLETLTRHGRQAEARSRTTRMESWSDDLGHLSAERRASWRRILSSVATTEGLEETLMEPMVAAMRARGDASALEYLESHAADERRHHSLLTSYLKGTFSFVKKKRTLTDQVLYDRAFPGIAQAFKFKPLYGFALLYCYERFSITFYAKLRTEAQADGAQNLTTLLQAIEKDELRHVAGMEHLLGEEIRARGGVSVIDRQAVAGLLRLMLLDLDMRPWAFYNREVRAHVEQLGLDPIEMTSAAHRMKDETLAFMAKLGASSRESRA